MSPRQTVPGKRTRSADLAGDVVQRKVGGVSGSSAAGAAERAGDWVMSDGLMSAMGMGRAFECAGRAQRAGEGDVERSFGASFGSVTAHPGHATSTSPIQQRASGGAADRDPAAVHEAAKRGLATPSSPLPHAETIQRSFGHHDISAIQAHVGADAAASARAMGAQAYATGAHVVLGDGADLHTVAHEAAHVVQQRAGVQLKGGVGEVGDLHEQHADAVADLVVRGESAAELLDSLGGTRAVAAVAPEGAVQAYSRRRASDIDVSDDVLFRTHESKPTSKDDVLSLEYPEHQYRGGEVGLLVAGDQTLAIHDTAEEPKEFYATSVVIENANQELAKVNSPILLEDSKADAHIQIDGRELRMVKPIPLETFFGDRPEGDAKGALAQEDPGFNTLATDECVQVATKIMGMQSWSHDLVLRDGEYRVPSVTDTTENETANAVASYLVAGPAEPELASLSAAVAPGGLVNEATQAPDDDDATRLDERAAWLGVNRHARPNVGEAYAIYSQRRAKPESKSSVEPAPVTQAGGHVWGYHFAAVVATSEDGEDRVTLENYNRRNDIDDEILNQQRLIPAARDIFERLQAQPGFKEMSIGQQTRLLTNELRKTKEVQAALRATLASTRWFFRMYGSRRGQSFHERQSETNAFVNPITVRVGPEDPERVKAIEQLRISIGTWETADGLSEAVQGKLGDLGKEVSRKFREYLGSLKGAHTGPELEEARQMIERDYQTEKERMNQMVDARERRKTIMDTFRATFGRPPTPKRQLIEILFAPLLERVFRR